jgi:hypothetical protein
MFLMVEYSRLMANFSIEVINKKLRFLRPAQARC